MAKVVKDTRETIDVDSELKKIKGSKKETKKVNSKDVDKKKNTTKKTTKNNKNTKKKSKSSVGTFFKEVRSEVSKVKWPSKKDMFKYSLATIVFVLFFALFFYAIDAIIALLKEVI